MNSYLMELLLRAAKVIVVLVERVLEAHRKVTLCGGQAVGSCGSGVINRWCAVAAECDGGRWRLGQEGICLADDVIDACISAAVGNIELRREQVTRQTSNRIGRLGAAAVHRIEDSCHKCSGTNREVAQSDRQEPACLTQVILPITWGEWTVAGVCRNCGAGGSRHGCAERSPGGCCSVCRGCG